MQSLINIIQDNNRVITIKKGKGKLPLFCGNGEWVILVYICARRMFKSPTSRIYVHAWQITRACSTLFTLVLSFGRTYALMTYHFFHSAEIVKLTIFGP